MADVPYAIVNDYQDAARDGHVAAVGSVAWQPLDCVPDLPFVNVPGCMPLKPNDNRARIPALDGDRTEILAELNFE